MNLTFIRTYVHHTARCTHRNSYRNNDMTPAKKSSPRRNSPAHISCFVFRLIILKKHRNLLPPFILQHKS